MKTKYASTDKRGQQKLAIALTLIPNTPPLPADAFSLIVGCAYWVLPMDFAQQIFRVFLLGDAHQNKC